MTLLSLDTCSSVWALLFATQNPVLASGIAMGMEAFPTSASDTLAAGRYISDIKTCFLTALIAQLLVLLPSRNLLA